MRRIPLKLLLILIISSLSILYLYVQFYTTSNSVPQPFEAISSSERWLKTSHNDFGTPLNTRIVISFVVCDTRFNESMNLVKSIFLFTRAHVHLVIFTDDILWTKFNETLTKLKAMTNNQLGFELHTINFPEPNREDWLNLFSKCAAQRLFIPKLIPHIDSMIYVDTDTLFLGPVEELWSYFSQFNASQLSAMTLEDDNPNVSWYPRFAKHPFYGKYGLNSGVMLMNLTRMRDFGWVDYVTPIMLKWKLYIPWGDQCADATSKGVFLLHGSRKAFHNNKQPALQAVYRAIDEHKLGTDPYQTLLTNIEKYITESPTSNCGNLKAGFLRVPSETFKDLY